MINIYPYDADSSTELLVAVHLPVVLWFAAAYPYMSGTIRSHERRMDMRIRFLVVVLACCTFAACSSSSKPAADSASTTTAGTTKPNTTAPSTPDPQVWLCKPGLASNPCLAELTATTVLAGGATTVERSKPADDPTIDCFYVYPTVSNQPTPNANLKIDPAETGVAIAQASRFSPVSTCTRRCTGR